MSEKTMLDLGGLAFVEGDPLGLREIEESLVWKANGPLPDWLEDADPPDDDDQFEQLPQTPVILEPILAPPPTPPAAVPVKSTPVLADFGSEQSAPSPPGTPGGEGRGEGGQNPAQSQHLLASEISSPQATLSPSPPTPLPRSTGGEGSCETSPHHSPTPETPGRVVIVGSHESGPAAPSLLANEALAAELVESETARSVDVTEAPGEPIAAPEEDLASHGLVSINEILRFVDDDPLPAPARSVEAIPVDIVETPAPVAGPARRILSLEELVDARLCLLTSVAGQLWAIPLDRVVAVSPREVADAIDLHERQEGKKRRGAGVAILFDTDRTLIVDRILGPRTFGWDQLSPTSNAPSWALAHTNIAGERINLLDWEAIA